MASDRGWLPRVAPRPPQIAWLALIAACAPTVKPPMVPPDPGPVAKLAPAQTGSPGRHVVVGEMCPQGAAGRPAVAPLLMRGVGWVDNAAEVTATVERGTVPRFAVFGVDGKLAGAFDTLGMVDLGLQQSVASGTYTGAAPCTFEFTSKPTADKLATRAEDPKCGPATGGCGLAVGEITRSDEPLDVPAYTTGGACLAGNELVVDIDGDGRPESFPIGDVLDGIRGPASEWAATAAAAAACKPQFQLFDIKLAADAEPGKPVDPKSTVMLDVLGVIDLDGDGRRELVLALRFPTVRSIVIYTATTTPERLELAGEATSFLH